MPYYVYIHGFNSGKGSRSGQALEQVIGAPVFCPVSDYSRPFMECMASLEEQISKNCPATEEQICVMGTSLGGFYALQTRLPVPGRVIAWNPVIYPALQLAQFVGKNRRFTDNQEWDFPQSSLLSYAAAPDPREWSNFYQASLLEKNKAEWTRTLPVPPRFVVLGVHDDLLNPQLAHAYWQDHARLLEIDAGHHVEDFSHVLTLLE